MPRLYAAQQQRVDAWFRLAKPRRKIWVWGTGTGKTAGALSAVAAAGYVKVLVVCPALVRRHWLREVAKWTTRRDAACIEMGQGVKVSGPTSARRAQTYAANIQIVSYDLVGEVAPTGWNLIVFDELHHLATPSSQQARRCEALLQANPSADVLGLTATLIPTEAAQVWNPLRLFFGATKWGKPAGGRNGVNWNFRMRYCHVEKTEYGVDTWGCREDRRKELMCRMKSCVAVLHREDIIKELPPLDLSLLDLASVARNQTGQDRIGHSRMSFIPVHARTLIMWAEACAEDTSHIVILVHHRDLVEELRRQLVEEAVPLRNHDIRVVTGAMTPTARQNALDAAGKLERCVLVGTHDSVAEGVRMMWAKQVLIDEWSMSPGRVLQVLGRFQSVGSKQRPCVHLRTTGDTWATAEKLLERVRVVQDLLGGGHAVEELSQVLRRDEPSAEDVAASWLGLLSAQRTGELVEQEEKEAQA